jgi:hypothetical protein
MDMRGSPSLLPSKLPSSQQIYDKQSRFSSCNRPLLDSKSGRSDRTRTYNLRFWSSLVMLPSVVSAGRRRPLQIHVTQGSVHRSPQGAVDGCSCYRQNYRQTPYFAVEGGVRGNSEKKNGLAAKSQIQHSRIQWRICLGRDRPWIRPSGFPGVGDVRLPQRVNHFIN